MTRVMILLAAGAATLAVAVPAAAQTPYTYPQPAYQSPYAYPQQTYPPGYNPQQGYPQGQYAYPQGQDSIGQIIGQLLGNRYQANDRVAVERCATAAMVEANTKYRRSPYGQGYGNQGYSNRGYYPSQMRVTAITDVRRRNNGVRVSGLLDSSWDNQRPYGNAYGYQGQGYQGQRYAQGDVTFRCNVAYNGAVTDVRVNRNRAAYNRGY